MEESVKVRVVSQVMFIFYGKASNNKVIEILLKYFYKRSSIIKMRNEIFSKNVGRYVKNTELIYCKR